MSGLDNCDRYLRFYLFKGETDRLVKRLAGLANLSETGWLPVQPLSGLLEEIGERTEAVVVAQLAAQGHVVHDLGALSVAETLDVLGEMAGQAGPVYLYQVPMAGRLGRWAFEGRADLVRVEVDEAGRFDALVMDIKASRKDKVQHRLQVAVYVRMLAEMAAQIGLEVNPLRGAIIRREADGALQNPAEAVPFELTPYLATVAALTEGGDSPLERVDAAPDLNALHYYLGPRCDGCSFSPVCLTESAERQDLSLVPFLESSDKRVLVGAGVTTLAGLAGLKEFVTRPAPPPAEDALTYETAPLPAATPTKERPRLEVRPGQAGLVETLSQRWPLAARLDRLIQRAQRTQRHFDRTTPARRYFVDRTPRRMRSNLPDDKRYPDLVKIFLEGQLDYLEDRLYLTGARIEGFGRVETVVEMTPDVPTFQSEQDLLTNWLTRVLAALASVTAGQETVRLHLYLYDRRDQKVLLDALRRHLDTFAALPALYALLTDTPALNQPALAFLYDEVNERLNLAGPLMSLQVVSRQLGFKWTDEAGHNFARLFRAGVFDYGVRRTDGVYIHTAARFHSNLPLEYAYGVWGRLPAKSNRAYRQASRPQLEAFQAHRLQALSHIEASFPYKNSYLVKEPINLAGLLETPSRSPTGDLASVLEQFLHIEQYSQLQQHLERFARPILRRVESGQALLVRCTEVETVTVGTGRRGRKQFHASFLAEYDKVGIHPQIALEICKLKEGDFVTLSPLEKDGQPWEIVGGRLARLEGLSGEWARLELSGSTLGKGQHSAFRYYHDRDLMPQPGAYYTIDPMVDNLNGDKLQDACRHAATNTLYALALNAPPTAPQPDWDEIAIEWDDLSVPDPSSSTAEPFDPASFEEAARHFADLIEIVETSQRRPPTADQLEVICRHLAEPLLLVQGPPGTGKSHTIGWAILARLYAALSLGANRTATEPSACRVIVSSQTHNAVHIVLESVAQKWQLLQTVAPTDERVETLQALRLYKAGGGAGEDGGRRPEIGFIDPWNSQEIKAALDGSPALVIGATPGNLYNLMRHYYGKGRGPGEPLFWQSKFFDLLVLDEASQMNLPHALLAAGWLKPGGGVVVVGDHRQLSPILTHQWEHEEHLPTVEARPYRSVFQFFLEGGWQRVALSESFRLHSVQAAFLNENIYRQDGIAFHSRQQKRLPSLTDPHTSAYLKAVLDPAYPIVVIEHNEANSQQYNPTEVELISPLIAAAIGQLGLDGLDGLGIVVPHRAQKAVLQNRFPALARAQRD